MTQHERVQSLMPPMAMHDKSTPCVVKGEGCYLYTEDGRKILDFASGIATNALGHCHPKVVAAAEKQLHTLVHAGHNILYYEPYTTLAEQLIEKTGGKYKLYFSNSGAEANEGAMKLAKYATQRPVIISMKNAFHGRTMATATITTSNAAYRKNYEPMMPSVYFAEYPYLFRTPYQMEDGKCPKEYFTQFYDLFKKIVEPSMVAAIIMEPIQGEGGYVVPPLEWLKYVRALCDQHRILLIFDEIQSGFGRTGNLYAWQTLGIEPDIFTSAKAIGGGLPLSAVFGKSEIMDKWGKGAHGGTFGGNPVSCAAALAVMEELFEGGVLENCRKMGEIVRTRMHDLQQKYSVIGDVRGMGLMNAMEFVKPEDNAPNGALCSAVITEALKRDLLLLSCGADKNNIRLIPPLNVDEGTLDAAFQIIDESIAAALKS
ncbi:aminotransferase class III-fold pyridoxal phosphate-dependent enzyme [Oscillibacter sp. GMB15532]|uniref:aminotransferase class III-fold pyridoxal phosphate-dependent enzyme n=1 Tax=Oscillibacter sp. GMB15532 TaxID=3230022 RepID=UPI0034DEA159